MATLFKMLILLKDFMPSRMTFCFKHIFLLYTVGILFVGLLSCKDDEDNGMGTLPLTADISVSSELNPSGYAPLSALLNVQIDTTASLEIILKGRQGSRSDIRVLACLLYTSPSPRDLSTSRMPSSA